MALFDSQEFPLRASGANPGQSCCVKTASKASGSSGRAESDECRATLSFHFYSEKTTALPPSLPLKHPTGLLTFSLTNNIIFPLFWVDYYARAAASGTFGMSCTAGMYPKNRADEHWETFDKIPVVQVRLQRELFLQQLPWAAAFVSQQQHVKCHSPKGLQLLLQSQRLQKSWKREWEGEGEKCNSNIPC